MMKNKISLIRRDPQSTGSRIWNCSLCCSRSLSPPSLECRGLYSVTESKWICFFPDYIVIFSLSLPTHPPQLRNLYWNFSLLLSPSKIWKYTYFNVRISDIMPFAATILLCGVANVARWVVGKCLLENCLICYTLLSPNGKSASFCWFGKFSEMIPPRKISAKHFPS